MGVSASMSPDSFKNCSTLLLRSLSKRESTVNVRTRAIVRTSASTSDLRKSLSSISSDISLMYPCNAASCWLSEAILCSFLRSARLKKIAIIASARGIISSCSQSHSFLPDLLFPLKPVQFQFNLYPPKITSTTSVINNEINTVVTGCVIICCRHERNLATIVPPLLHHDEH